MWRSSTAATIATFGVNSAKFCSSVARRFVRPSEPHAVSSMRQTVEFSRILPSAAAVLVFPSSLPSRHFSSKSPRRRVELHPHQKRTHEAAARAAEAALKRGMGVDEAFKVAGEAAKMEGDMEAQAPGGDQAAENSDLTLTLPSTLLSNEPAPKRPPAQSPSSFDSQGRALLRTRLHPKGAIVGRGRVVANFGTQCLVMEVPWDAESERKAMEAAKKVKAGEETPAEGLRFSAIPRGKLGKILCGDEVLWEWAPSGDNQAYIVEILPRRTEFKRVTKHTGGKGNGPGDETLLASNFDHVAIICAPLPPTNATLLDRYVAMAERWGVKSSIVFNKQDLPIAGEFNDIFADYERVGVKVFRTSCAPGKEQGIEELRKHLATVGPNGKPGITIFVGQSGSGQCFCVAVDKEQICWCIPPHCS
jgi:hypothetical protein